MLFSTLNVALGLLAAFLTESASAARRDGLSKELGNWQSLERNVGDPFLAAREGLHLKQAAETSPDSIVRRSEEKIWSYDAEVGLAKRSTSTDAVPPSNTLKPATPLHVNSTHVTTLHPATQGDHYYTPGGDQIDDSVASLFATANISYQYPTVILPHSDLLSTVDCVSVGFEIEFFNTEAFAYVETHWAGYLGSSFVMVTSSLSCNVAEDGMHAYWNVTNLAYNRQALTVVATADEVAMKEVYKKVSVSWGSTTPVDGSGKVRNRFSARAGDHAEAASVKKTATTRKRAVSVTTPAILQPWYANVPQANFSTVAYSLASVTAQYYVTPPTGISYSSTERFTLLVIESNSLSNTSGTLVYGYGGMSLTQIQPNAYYSITNPARQIAPGYSLPALSPGACPVRLISYLYREPATGVTDVSAPSTRDAFNVTIYALSQGLGSPVAINIISVVNGNYPASCSFVSASTSLSSTSLTSSTLASTRLTSSNGATTTSASRIISSTSSRISSISSTTAPTGFTTKFITSSPSTASTSSVNTIKSSSKMGGSNTTASSKSSSREGSSSATPSRNTTLTTASSASTVKSSTLTSSTNTMTSYKSSSQRVSSSATSFGKSTTTNESSSALPSSTLQGTTVRSTTNKGSGALPSSTSRANSTLPITSIGRNSSSNLSVTSKASTSTRISNSTSITTTSHIRTTSSAQAKNATSVWNSTSTTLTSTSSSSMVRSNATISTAATSTHLASSTSSLRMNLSSITYATYTNSTPTPTSVAVNPPYNTTVPVVCLNPPVSYMGFPTAPCGEDFDTLLDAEIGFLDFANDFAGAFAIFVSRTTVDPVYRRGLLRRCWFCWAEDAWDAVVNVVVYATTKVYDQVSGTLIEVYYDVQHEAEAIAAALARAAAAALAAAEAEAEKLAAEVIAEAKAAAAAAQVLATQLANDAQTVANAVVNALNVQYSPSFSGDVPVTLGEGNVDSPWGTSDAYLLFQYPAKNDTEAAEPPKDGGTSETSAKIEIYCVDCGVTAATTIGGSATFHVFPPELSDVEVTVSGSISAGVHLGVYAEIDYQYNYRKTLIKQTVPDAGITVGDLLSIGVILNVVALAAFELKIDGQALVGVDFNIDHFEATLGLFGSDSSASGDAPSYSPVFNASAEVVASLGLSMPIEFGIGLVIPAIEVEKMIGLRNTPKFTAEATLEVQTDSQDLSGCDNGIGWDIGVQNVLDFDIAGVKTYNLYTWEKDLYSGCYLIPGLAHPTSAFSTSPITASSTTASSSTATSSTSPPATTTRTGTSTLLSTTASTATSSSSSNASASKTSSSAATTTSAKTSLTVAANSPLSSGPIEYAEYRTYGFQMDENFDSFYGEYTEASCLALCLSYFFCTTAVYATTGCFLSGDFTYYDATLWDPEVARPNGMVWYAVGYTCAQLAVTPLGALGIPYCKQYFPLTSAGIASDSPNAFGKPEYAKYQDFAAFNGQLYSGKYTSDQCLSLCLGTAGCTASALAPTQGCWIASDHTHLYGDLSYQGDAVVTWFILDTTCYGLAALYSSRAAYCFQYFPDTFNTPLIYDGALDSPNDASSSGSVYAEYQAYSSTPASTSAPIAVTSMNQCLTYCLVYGSDCFAASYDASSRVCRMSHSGFQPSDLVLSYTWETVILRSCVDVSRSGGLSSELACSEYYPSRITMETYPVAADSPALINFVPGYRWAEYQDVVPMAIFDFWEGYLDRNCPTMECCYTTCSGSLAAAMSWFHSSPTEFARSTRYRTPVAGDCYCWTERMLNDGGDGLHQFSYDPSSVTTLMFESCDISNSSISHGAGFDCETFYPALPALISSSKRSELMEIRQTTTTNGTSGTSYVAGILDAELPSIFDDPETVALVQVAINATLAATAANASAPHDFVIVLDVSSSYALATDVQGNLFMADPSKVTIGQFYLNKNMIFGDGSSSAFFYFPDEMAAFGVSRFRFNDFNHIPRTSGFIALTPINYDQSSSTPGIFVATNSKAVSYFTVICLVGGNQAKIFLVSDISAGITTLQRLDLEYVITGGPVGNCTPLLLKTTGFPGYS